MKALKRVDSFSVGKVFGLLYACGGFIGGLILTIVSLVAPSSEAGALSLIFGVGAIILLPIVYGVLGWIGGIIVGFLYNIVSKRTGGIKFELADVAEVTATVSTPGATVTQ